MVENRPRSISGAPPSQPPDVAKLAGRGAIYITLAKAYFLLTGFATYLVLPRVLSVEEFGLYSVAVGVASIINAVVMTGTLQTVSKFVSQDETRAEAVKRKALRIQVFFGGGIAGAYFFLAPRIAHYLHDPRLTHFFRMTAFVTFIYSIYAVFLGTVNGRREFLKQAFMDSSYSTFKMIFVIALASVGFRVEGALGGWVLASLAVLALAFFVVGWREKIGDIRARELLSFQSNVLVFILIVNLLQKVDLLLVKALSSSDPSIASRMAGSYNAVMNIANVTFQSIIAVTFVVFPLVSEATFKGNRIVIQQYISQALRFSFMLMVLLATLFSSNAFGLVSLIYKPEYLAGVDALRIVPFGMLWFGWLYVVATIISSSGKPRVSVVIGAVTLFIDAILNYLLIPKFNLVGAALATTIAMSVGAIIGSFYVWNQFGALLSMLSVVRIMIAGLGTYLLAVLMPASRLSVMINLIVQSVAYVGLLLLFKELGPAEFIALRRMFPRAALRAENK